MERISLSFTHTLNDSPALIVECTHAGLKHRKTRFLATTDNMARDQAICERELELDVAADMYGINRVNDYRTKYFPKSAA